MPHRSLWLQQALDDAPPAPALSGTQRADVAILGGGYVGLWAAIQLKRREPDCDVVVLERDVCGGGASGRNGGMVLSWWPKLASLIKLCGVEEALRLGRASAEAIDGIAAFCDQFGVDAEFRRGGFLWTATTPAHIGAWNGVVDLCERHGVDAFERLPAAEVARRSGSDRHLAGVFEARAATVQPAKLARGLRAAALSLGVRIYEGTPALSFTRERPLVVDVPGGKLAADKLVVAMNAWAAALPELRRALVIVSSDIVATPPIPDRLAEIGWTGGEGITDSQMMVAYYRTTADGRIAFGKGTAGVSYGSRVDELFDRNPGHSAMTAADFRRYYPALADVGIEHDWGGPIDRTPTSVPILGHLGGREHIVYGVGWSGNGVGPSFVGGRMLASLALGERDEWSVNGLIDRAPDSFPPEPVRFLGARLVREAVIRKERSELAGRPPRALAVRVAALAPAGLEDKD
ncbi:MAG TPA: FAD-binding oxidoreductase [Solirubrobacter sp.]|nr:FAD-binding oxidoreductase [Solirubrobacter sp.]